MPPPPRNVCGARNRQGSPCRRPAGWGTDHVGTGRCKLHGGASHGAPKGNANNLQHGLRAKYIREEELAAVFPDPALRMQVLASLMTHRALAAHAVTVDDAERDTDATDARIARAVRTAAQATRVELSALKLKADGDEPVDEVVVTVRKLGDGPDSER